MNISADDFNSYVKSGLSILDNKPQYTNQMQTDVFWKTQIEKEWLCLNIEVQSSWYGFLYNHLINSKLVSSNMKVYDYGCGSGTFSLLLNEIFNFDKVTLSDLDNYSSKFIDFYIKKNQLSNVVWHNVLENNHEENYDLVISLDVLEHLEESYQSLIHLDSKLKKGGVLFLKIAFEVEDKTHLPQAAEDFFIKNDGMGFLAKNYDLINDIGHGQIVNGIFVKKTKPFNQNAAHTINFYPHVHKTVLCNHPAFLKLCLAYVMRRLNHDLCSASAHAWHNSRL